jgi:SAM-dependent methyltransferase
MTAAEWRRFGEQLRVGPDTEVLEVGSGSGGPAVYLAAAMGCRMTGVDVNERGVRNGAQLAARQGVAERVTFHLADASQPLPFPDASFDAIVSNDAICHLPDRLARLREWHRLLRRQGRVLFTDALVVTGPLTNEELATRSSIGFYVFVPAGENERLIERAGFRLLACDDLTDAAAAIAGQWHDARARHRAALQEREGVDNFEGLQRFLACVRRVSAERRLSRFAYLAEWLE